MTSLALLPRSDWNATVAWHAGQAVSLAAFVRDIRALAAQLPEQGQVINLCSDRYLFALGFFAATLRGTITLLPNAVSAEMYARLHSEFPQLQALTEIACDAGGLPELRVGRTPDDAPLLQDMPQIPVDRVVARLYTSGSTGVPQPHDKTWGKLVANILAAAEAQWAWTPGPCSVLGTVPAQHMFGFESSLLLPLLAGGVLQPERPFFPADVAAALAAMPRPRCLVTTPFHLRTLLEAGVAVPQVDLIICATAPLSQELAAQAEKAMDAVLCEIYGSTETGQIATRRTVMTNEWQGFKGITLHDDDGRTWAQGGHIEQAVALGDLIEHRPPADSGCSRFVLQGRLSDMINIAGKRTSLAYLNTVLNSIEGVVDGVFHQPTDETPGIVARLGAFVVAPSLKPADILDALRQRIDPVFMPRPLVFVTELPRNNTGKLTHAAMQSLSKDLTGKHA
ncbi:AMP-binding protein [Uliginosibacterium sp. H3]|uniref:AMP-binding protein n=1 Tax=Uliginosibacterium silvisoli TaxID=3114758 RepID=A0ABU6JXU6_9RHOO|nr:AMP-binding protein [Uliginosibacterium sp. H3]